MLVLSRKETERVHLGNDIIITVVRVAGDKVRLGIEAPAEMRILRGELAPHASAESNFSLPIESGLRNLWSPLPLGEG